MNTAQEWREGLRQISVAPVSGNATLPKQSGRFKLRLVSVDGAFSAVVADRVFGLRAIFGGVVQVWSSYALQFSANQTAELWWSQSGVYYVLSPIITGAHSIVHLPLPHDLVMDERFLVELSLNGFQVGDVVSQVSFVVEDITVDE